MAEGSQVQTTQKKKKKIYAASSATSTVVTKNTPPRVQAFLDCPGNKVLEQGKALRQMKIADVSQGRYIPKSVHCI